MSDTAVLIRDIRAEAIECEQNMPMGGLSRQFWHKLDRAFTAAENDAAVIRAAEVLVAGGDEDWPWWAADDVGLAGCIGCGGLAYELANLEHDHDCSAMALEAALNALGR